MAHPFLTTTGDHTPTQYNSICYHEPSWSPKGRHKSTVHALSETTSILAPSFSYGSSPSQAPTYQCLRVPALQGSVAFSHDVSSLLAEVVDKDSTLWHIPPKKIHSQQLHLPSIYKHKMAGWECFYLPEYSVYISYMIFRTSTCKLATLDPKNIVPVWHLDFPF